MPRPIFSDVHDVKQLDPRGSHFQISSKASPSGKRSAMPRVRAYADRLTTRIAHTQVMRAVRMPSQLAWYFLRYSGPFLPSCLLGGGVFVALPPAIPVLLTLVRVYASVE